MSGDDYKPGSPGALLQAVMDKLEDMERKLDALGLGFFGKEKMDSLIARSSPTRDHLRMLAEAEQSTMAHQVPVTFEGTKVGEATLQQVEDGVMASMSFAPRPPATFRGTLTDAELDKIKRDLQAAVTRPHPVAPAPGAIVFGPDMRELDPDRTDTGFPLLSTCTCGRQITVIAIGHAWEYCGA